MATYYQELDSKIDTALRTATHLVGTDHTADDLREIALSIGAATELFLKRVIFEGARDTADFAGVISGLKSFGIASAERDKFHGLRDIYNDCKHNPSYSPDVDTLCAALTAAQEALADLNRRNLGKCQRSVTYASKRRFWIYAHDHYIGGQTEITLCLPMREEDGWLPYSVDVIYIDMSSWDNVKNELIALGLKDAEGIVPNSFYEQFRKEEDSLYMGVFEGSYRDALTIVGKYVRNLPDLIDDLKRENHPQSVRAALLMSAVDLISDGENPSDTNAFTDALVQRADEFYGLPLSNLVSQMANEVSQLISEAQRKIVNTLSGPFWYGDSQYQQSEHEAVAKSEKLGCHVRVDGRLICR